MSRPVKTHGDPESSATFLPTEQLATPALTPISEHGDREGQRFPAWEATLDDEVREEHAVRYPTLSRRTSDQSRRPSDLSIRANGLVSADARRKSSAGSPKANRLSPNEIHDLISSPDSLPIRSLDSDHDSGRSTEHDASLLDGRSLLNDSAIVVDSDQSAYNETTRETLPAGPDLPSVKATPGAVNAHPPGRAVRSASTPHMARKSSSSKSVKSTQQLAPIRTKDDEKGAPHRSSKSTPIDDSQPSPMPAVIPAPPLSLPTYLQLELSSDRPSALYIHRSSTSDIPYESSEAKFERLQNFLLLPPNLEQVLWFGAVACLDAWLYTFTILPLRFLKAIAILAQWMAQNAAQEIHDLGGFVYQGLGRVWQRRRQSSTASSRRPSVIPDGKASRRPSTIDDVWEETHRTNGQALPLQPERKSRRTLTGFRHRRTKSTPSDLLPNHKADILQGLLIAVSCMMLMWLDASRMYHNIRGQAAIKLYVIYNVLEVFDRLFSALGQDVLECLFSKETLERDEYGRSKILRPLWMFLLALAYNVLHSTALFYQVVTLNVAVNSYSNALLTLLMSNQFVEIKGTVFKKFEKENLFQLTCADVVERFQLWLMLLIIALRNFVEVGGLSISLNSVFSSSSLGSDTANATSMPLTSNALIPAAFTVFPKWTGEVLGPFLIVLGSEALVDWCKHAYITKFNQVKPNIYGRFLDVLAKDYYSHAFADQNLTKRLGLPVIPLSCLFIRACVQTYHMFLATYMPLPVASTATGISLDNETEVSSSATTAALQHVDHVFRRALGRSSFGAAGSDAGSAFSWWSVDDFIAFATMAIFFLALYLVLLALKLVLGMALLSFARRRYKGMKERERQGVDTHGRRVGGWGMVEVNEDKRRWIYDDDPDGLRVVREKEERGRRKIEKGEGMKLDGVQRYSMAAKRIW